MPLNHEVIGAPPKQRLDTLSVRRLLAYAAGIGADEPVYLDDCREGGLIGFPALCVSLEWDNRHMAEELGYTAEESVRGVHASQDSVFHRPLRPGQELRTETQVTGAYETRAGMRTVIQIRITDAASGEPVVTSWTSHIMRGMHQPGLPVEAHAEPEVPKLELDLDRAERISVPIARELPHSYTECASIWNPVHTEREVALGAGLPDIILHGTATWALAGRELIRKRADGDPTRLRRLHGRFTGMVIPGAPIEIRIGPAHGSLVAFDVLNAQGKAAISDGIAELS